MYVAVPWCSLYVSHAIPRHIMVHLPCPICPARNELNNKAQHVHPRGIDHCANYVFEHINNIKRIVSSSFNSNITANIQPYPQT